jgi:hypothetical protein
MRAERKILWFLAACLALLFLTPFARHFEVKWELERYRKKLKADGEKLEIAELTSNVLPESTNAAQARDLMRAIPFPSPLYPYTTYVRPGVVRIAWRETVLNQDAAVSDTDADLWKRLRTAQEANQQKIRDVTKFFNNATAQWISYYSQNKRGDLPFSISTTRLGIFLGGVAVLNLHDGNQQDAYESLRAEGAVAQLCSDSPVEEVNVFDLQGGRRKGQSTTITTERKPQGPAKPSTTLNRHHTLLRRADANGLGNRIHVHLAISDLAGFGRADDRVQNWLDQGVGQNDFQFDLGQQIRAVFAASVILGAAFLPPETFDFTDGHSSDAYVGQGIADFIEFEWFYNRFDFFHTLFASG